MGNRKNRGFILENSLAAVSAAICGSDIIATDGSTKSIYIIKEGEKTEALGSLRAYRRLRPESNATGSAFTALCGNTDRIYFIDGGFAETGFVDLQTLRDGDMNEITDAGVCHVGGKRFFFGAFRKTAYLFDVCGNRLAKLFNTPEGARLTDFLPVTPEFYAACFEQNRMRFVFVNDNGKESRATVPPGSSLRMLFAGEDGIYALFGTNYIYNRITRIYSSGVLDLTPACDT